MKSDDAETQGDACPRCEGKGWVGTATAGQFAYIGKLAMQGRLPTAPCSRCNGTGRATS